MFRFHNKVQLIKKIRELNVTTFSKKSKSDKQQDDRTICLRSCLEIVNLVEKEVGTQLWEKL